MSQMASHLPLSSMQTIGHNMAINSSQLNVNSNANQSSNQSTNPLSTTNPTTNTSNSNQSICCLIEDTQRCQRMAGNASYSKRIEKQVTQRKLRLTVDQRSHHMYICEHHKQMIQSIRSSNKRKRKDSDDDNDLSIDNDMHNTCGQDVDLLALQVNTLRRYKKHYRIQTRPGLNKSQLAESLQRHFKSMPIFEKEAITYFIYMVKCNKNKLDNNANAGKGSTLPSD